jgi:hypothetical protein
MFKLQDIIRNRAWLKKQHPFPHVTATGVFVEEFFHDLETEYSDLLQSGVSEDADRRRFSRSISGYDAYAIGFSASTRGALAVFCSPEWSDLLAGLFNVSATGHVNVGAHHHELGSNSGWIHNDFNPVWFPSDGGGGTMRFPDHGRCSYKTGAGSLPAHDKTEVVRAVAMIFYLFNGGWKNGDGGETGLFRAGASIDAPTARVPPVNNSILAFECTPHSAHAFLHNPGRARNSVIMWIHRSMGDALARWPETALERWAS